MFYQNIKLKLFLIIACSSLVVYLWLSSRSNVKTQEDTITKQELVRGNGAEPASLDPGKAEGIPESAIIRDMFEGLATQDRKGEVIPGVAHKWEKSQDGLSYTFYLRDSTWSNGDPLTAQDFVYTWRRLADPKTGSAYSGYLEISHIKNASQVIEGKLSPDNLGVEAINTRTLRVHLDQKVPYFAQMMCHFSLSPVHQKTIEKYGDQWTKPENIVSNGAYKLDKWIVNGRVILKRNPLYWNNSKTTINKVTFLPSVSESAELNQYLAGQIDITYWLPVDQFERMKKNYPSEVKVTGYLAIYYYLFNTSKPPFDDVRVRRAFSYAIDRNIITQKITKRGEIPAYNFTPDIVAGYIPKSFPWEKLSQTERNELARELLQEAHFDFSMPIEILYNTNEDNKKIAVTIASMWKKNLGINVQLINEEWKTYLETRKGNNWTVARAGWVGDYNEASTFLGILTCDNALNSSKWCNEKYDTLLIKSLNAKEGESSHIYNEMEAIISAEQPIAPIYQYVRARMVKPHVGGYARNAEDRQYSKNLFIR